MAGRSCPACGLHTVSATPRCPSCRGDLVESLFGPEGTVWSSTVVRVPIPGRTPPTVMAYVDLDDGPRVLCHVAAATDRVPIGRRVRVVGTTASGDLEVSA